MRRRIAAGIGSLPRRWRSRCELERLNSHMLRDIGFERIDDNPGNSHLAVLRRD